MVVEAPARRLPRSSRPLASVVATHYQQQNRQIRLRRGARSRRGKSFVRHKNKVAVFNRISGDSVVGKSTLSLGGSVQDASEATPKTGPLTPRRSGQRPRAHPGCETCSSHHRRCQGGCPDRATLNRTGLGNDRATINLLHADGADIEIDGNYVGSTPSTVGATAGQHQTSLQEEWLQTLGAQDCRLDRPDQGERRVRAGGEIAACKIPVRTALLPSSESRVEVPPYCCQPPPRAW